MNRKIFAAEFVGTTVLMLGGPGSAILAGNAIGTLGVALAFGFSLLIAASQSACPHQGEMTKPGRPSIHAENSA